MNQRGNFHQNPYSGGAPGWGESPMHQRGPHPGGSAGIWGQRGPSPHNRSFDFEHGRGPPNQSPNPRQSPRGQFSPMYTSSPAPYIMQQQTPQQQFRGGHRGGNSPGFHFSGRKSHGGSFTSSPRQKNGENMDISVYYKHSMVEDPWKDLIPATETMMY